MGGVARSRVEPDEAERKRSLTRATQREAAAAAIAARRVPGDIDDVDEEPTTRGPATLPMNAPPVTRDGRPKGTAQRNFTDPASRIQKTGDGFIQGYNAQAAVDAAAQVIVAHTVTPIAADVGQLVPLVTAVTRTCRRKPRRVLADAGYCSDANLHALECRGIEAYIATGRLKHTEWQAPAPRGRPPAGLTRRERMARKLRTLAGRAVYACRKSIVEPVFGQIKHARDFRRFLRRGTVAVQHEWGLVCTAHDLLKLYAAVGR